MVIDKFFFKFGRNFTHGVSMKKYMLPLIFLVGMSLLTAGMFYQIGIFTAQVLVP